MYKIHASNSLLPQKTHFYQTKNYNKVIGDVEATTWDFFQGSTESGPRAVLPTCFLRIRKMWRNCLPTRAHRTERNPNVNTADSVRALLTRCRHRFVAQGEIAGEITGPRWVSVVAESEAEEGRRGSRRWWRKKLKKNPTLKNSYLYKNEEDEIEIS